MPAMSTGRRVSKSRPNEAPKAKAQDGVDADSSATPPKEQEGRMIEVIAIGSVIIGAILAGVLIAIAVADLTQP